MRSEASGVFVGVGGFDVAALVWVGLGAVGLCVGLVDVGVSVAGAAPRAGVAVAMMIHGV